MRSKWIIAIMAMLALLWVVGCEGPEGPQGPAGEQGEPGDPGEPGPGPVEYTYLGDDANTCNHCHGDIVESWHGTGHSMAWDALMEEAEINLYCVQCHVTGFDAEVSYGDSLIETPGPDLSGWDDYWPPETEEDSTRLAHLENVQCEACHGPMGPTIYDHSPILNFNTGIMDSEDPSMCAKCHEQVEEWQESGHGMVLETHNLTMEEFNDEFNSFSTCWECHTAEGFASANDPYWSAQGRPETAHLISCQGCHDPMDATNMHQLRNLDDYTVVYDVNDAPTFTGYGTAQVCVQCHHARRDEANVTGQIESGSAHFGPHGSPQMDMFLGSGSYEIEGYDYDRDHMHQTIETSCVHCHMEMRGHSDPLGWKGGHDFEAAEATCQTSGCHSAAPPEGFDYGNLVTEINEKLDELIDLIGVDPDSLGSVTATTMEERMAGYAYQFVVNDGSHGVHNPTYAMDLLDKAIEFMSTDRARNNGGIAHK